MDHTRCACCLMGTAAVLVGGLVAWVAVDAWLNAPYVSATGTVADQGATAGGECWFLVHIAAPPSDATVNVTSPAPCNQGRVGTPLQMCHPRGRPGGAQVAGLPDNDCTTRGAVTAVTLLAAATVGAGVLMLGVVGCSTTQPADQVRPAPPAARAHNGGEDGLWAALACAPLLVAGVVFVVVAARSWERDRIARGSGVIVDLALGTDAAYAGLRLVCWASVLIPADPYAAATLPAPYLPLAEPVPCDAALLGAAVPTCHPRGRPWDARLVDSPDGGCAEVDDIVTFAAVGSVLLALALWCILCGVWSWLRAGRRHKQKPAPAVLGGEISRRRS